MKRTINTLFLIQSLDGKISTGVGDKRDIDKDAKKVGYDKGKDQYADYEQMTDLHSLNSGKVLAKLGINKKQLIKKTVVSFLVIDNSNLTSVGVKNLCEKSETFYLITSNKKHPAFNVKKDNLKILFYENKIDFKDMFIRFKNEFNIKRITIQTGGTLNSILLRDGLIDYVSIFIAPVLFGGKETPSLVDGKNLKTERDLRNIKKLKLQNVNKLKNSYLHLDYKINNK